jgi:hypothetical protein
MGRAVQHKDHQAFELGWKNGLHNGFLPANAELALPRRGEITLRPSWLSRRVCFGESTEQAGLKTVAVGYGVWKVVAVGLKSFPGDCSILGGFGLIAEATEHSGVKLADENVIIDQQNACGRVRLALNWFVG